MTWVTVALVVFIGLYFRERNRVKQLTDELAQNGRHEVSNRGPAHDDHPEARELEELRERVQVLERIATNENSAEARKAQRIAAEIESLRGDIAKRSSRNTEELSE